VIIGALRAGSGRPTVGSAAPTSPPPRGCCRARPRCCDDTLTSRVSLAPPRSCYCAHEVRASQAECRGFESRLPLHSLHSDLAKTPRLGVFSRVGRSTTSTPLKDTGTSRLSPLRPRLRAAPVDAAGRYRAAPTSPGTGDWGHFVTDASCEPAWTPPGSDRTRGVLTRGPNLGRRGCAEPLANPTCARASQGG